MGNRPLPGCASSLPATKAKPSLQDKRQEEEENVYNQSKLLLCINLLLKLDVLLHLLLMMFVMRMA